MASVGSTTSALIDQLIYIDSAGIRSTQAKVDSLNKKKDAIKELNTKVLDLQKAATELYKSLSEPTKTIVASKEGVADVSIKDASFTGNIYLDVKQLATNTIIGGDKFDGPVGIDGEFTIGSGDKTATIEIKAGDTIKSIKDKINKNKELGVTASIVDGRLTLSNKETGEKDITFEDPNGILEKIGIADSAGNAKNVLQKGQNAIFDLNGITIERESNVIEDALEGVTIKLSDVGTTNLKVEEDVDKLVEKFEEFVKKYNETNEAIDKQLKDTKGTLRSDSALTNLKSKMRSALFTTSNGLFKNMKDIGLEMSSVNFGKDAKLEIKDKDKLKDALKLNKDEVLDFLVTDNNNDNKLDPSDGGILGVLNHYLDLNTSSKVGKEGIFARKIKSIENSIESQESRIERMQTSMDKKRKVYEKQFLYMEQMTSMMNDQAMGLAGMLSQQNGSNGMY